jgi:hypothetical protein
LHGGDFALAKAVMGDPSENALARIEAAIARIEAAAARPRGDDPGLEARHQQLREAVTQSLHELDALIAGHTP